MSQIGGTLSLDTNAFETYNISESNSGTGLENTELNKVRLGRIKSIRVVNFKSFENQHYVGPFTKFTSIIGPNGGGKSNVLDAIQFVFGLSVRSMRCHKLDELIYSQAMYYKSFQQEQKEASVEIIFDAINYIEPYITIKRTINLQLQTSIYLGDHPISDKDFAAFLLLSKIILPAKNFIMLQGDTDNLATIEPKKLTELFEYASGSVQFKNFCVQIQQQLNQIVSRLRELQFQRGTMKTEQRKVKELKNTSDRYKKLSDEISQLKLKQKLFELKQIDEQIDEIEEEAQSSKNQESDFNDKNKGIIEEINKFENDISQLKQESHKITDSEKQIHKDERSKVYDTTQIDLQIELLNKQILTYEAFLSKIKKDLIYQDEMLDEINTEISGKQQQLEQLQKINNIQLPQQLLSQFKELQQQFKLKNLALESELDKLRDKFSMTQKLHDQIDDEIKQYKEDNDQLNLAKEEQKVALTYVNNELEVLKESYQNTLRRIDELMRQNIIEENELNELQSFKQAQERQLKLLEVQETENIEEKQTQLLIQQLKQMFKDFKGELSSLCNPEQQQFAIALKIALSQRILCSLVVENENTAKHINLHLKSLDTVKELIVLNRVKFSKDESILREKVEDFAKNYRKQNKNGRAYLAIDIIKYEDYLDKVLRSLLYGVVVCDNYSMAIELQKNQIYDLKTIITLDGISVSSSGMIIFNGSQQRLNDMRNFRTNNQRQTQKSSKDTKEQLMKSIEDLSNKIKSIKNVNVQDDLKYQQAMKIRLEEQQVQLSNKLIQNKKQITNFDERINNVQKLLKELENEFKIKVDQLKTIEIEQEKILEQLQSLQSQQYKNFAQKNNIDIDQLNQLDQIQTTNFQLEQKQQQLNKLNFSKQTMIQQLQDIKKKQLQMEQNLLENQENIKKYQLKKDEILQKHNTKDNSLKEINIRQNEINQQIKQIQKKLQQLIEQRNQQVRKGVDYKQQTALANRKLEQLNYQRGRIIEFCEIESIPVRYAKTQGTFQPSLNFDDQGQMEIAKIDYGPIKDDLRVRDKQKIIDELNQNLVMKEEEIAKYLSENLQIGLIGSKTDEKFVQLEMSMENISKQIKELQQQESELSQKLLETRKQRKERFDALFERVEKEIKVIYSKLTENKNKLGGTILLYLENKEEPFEGGIIYTPNPPNKKYIFDNTEQLSGGEKTVASLAMLLAINAAIEAPFILLDEVDAHLDQENAEKFQKIIKLLSTQIQFILVSHNPEVFGHSDSLVGVTIQHSKTTSEAFSLQL